MGKSGIGERRKKLSEKKKDCEKEELEKVRGRITRFYVSGGKGKIIQNGKEGTHTMLSVSPSCKGGHCISSTISQEADNFSVMTWNLFCRIV